MAFIFSYPLEVWRILLELAPSLLIGLMIAGLIHVLVPDGAIRRGLSGADLRSVVRASLVGVPLPLCSCGVIPTALGLRREGASRGAATAFMISTPQTGVDSILVTASFLGWPFAIFKLVAAFVTGVVGGVLVNKAVPEDAPGQEAQKATSTPVAGTVWGRVRELFRYAIFDLLGAIHVWLLIGVLVAALITTFTPPDLFIGQRWAEGIVGMLVMLAISLPLYVCTTASVPIAASLIAAGLPAGSALVFLMAGPATNVATIGAVYRTLGGVVLSLYLGTVILMSLGFGLMFDQLLSTTPTQVLDQAQHAHHTSALAVLSALVLVALLAMLFLRDDRIRELIGWRTGPVAASGDPATAEQADTIMTVKGMTCGHCVATVKRALESLDQVDEATPDLATGRVLVRGRAIETGLLSQAVEASGFKVVN